MTALSDTDAVIVERRESLCAHSLDVGVRILLAGRAVEVPIAAVVRGTMHQELHKVAWSSLIAEPGRDMVGCGIQLRQVYWNGIGVAALSGRDRTGNRRHREADEHRKHQHDEKERPTEAALL